MLGILQNSSALVERQKKTSLMQYPIIALMRGSHSLSARRAWRTLSSRPEGPQPRSQCNNSYNMYIVMFRCQMEGRVCTVQFFPFLEVLYCWTLNCSITCSSVSSTSSPRFPTINTWPGQKSTHSFNSKISLLFHHILFLSQQQICFCCPDVYFALSAMQLDARFKCLLFLSRTEQTGVVRAMDGPKFS